MLKNLYPNIMNRYGIAWHEHELMPKVVIHMYYYNNVGIKNRRFKNGKFKKRYRLNNQTSEHV